MPDVPSPNVQLYEVAFVVALASKVHVFPEQDFVKLATGAGGAVVAVTVEVLLLVPFASVTVSVTE